MSEINEEKLVQAFEDRGYDNSDASKLAALWLWNYVNDGEVIHVDEFDITGDLCECASLGSDYLVLTDDEADNMCRENLEQYVEDCVLSEIPQDLRFYFDDERFIKDVMDHDGRGPTLNPWDGCEYEYKLDTPLSGEWYYIYQQ